MTVRVAPEVAWVWGQGSRVVLLDLRDLASPPQVLADQAAVVWESLTRVDTREALAAEVASVYDLAAADVADDVDAFLDDLLRRGLVTED